MQDRIVISATSVIVDHERKATYLRTFRCLDTGTCSCHVPGDVVPPVMLTLDPETDFAAIRNQESLFAKISEPERRRRIPLDTSWLDGDNVYRRTG